MLKKLMKVYKAKNKCEDIPDAILEELKTRVNRVHICKFDDT